MSWSVRAVQLNVLKHEYGYSICDELQATADVHLPEKNTEGPPHLRLKPYTIIK